MFKFNSNSADISNSNYNCSNVQILIIIFYKVLRLRGCSNSVVLKYSVFKFCKWYYSIILSKIVLAFENSIRNNICASILTQNILYKAVRQGCSNAIVLKYSVFVILYYFVGNRVSKTISIWTELVSFRV